MNVRLSRFLSYYRPYRRLLIVDLLCAVVVAAITLIMPLGARYITQTILPSGAPDAAQQVLVVGAILTGLLLVLLACNTFVDYQGHMMGTLMEGELRRELFAHYLSLPVSYFDTHRTGHLMAHLTSDLFAMSELFHHGPEELTLAVLKFTGAFVILFAINPPLTLVIFAFVGLMAVYGLYFHRRMSRSMAAIYARLGDINARVEEALSGIRVARTFANEGLEMDRFDAENTRFIESRRDLYRSETGFYEGMLGLVQLLTILLVVLGSIAILNLSMTLPDLITYLLFAAILTDPINKFVNLSRLLQEGVTGFNRFLDVMAVQPDIADQPGAITMGHATGRIVFDQVRFRYHDDGRDVLSAVSLEIQPGEFVAIVGASGAGKSTLCALIPRLYEVSDGAIRLDGVDIRHITQESLRRQIGMVQQDVILFSGTVADNIGYGRPGASRDDIIRAARQANAHAFIESLPQGYDSEIGPRGVRLSGGQRQRLSIARAFLKDPPVLILDEATSALDYESERAVQESLHALSQGRTTIVIAHRLSTIREAKRILVLADQGIVEEGTHDELLARGGAYAALYALQAEFQAV